MIQRISTTSQALAAAETQSKKVSNRTEHQTAFGEELASRLAASDARTALGAPRATSGSELTSAASTTSDSTTTTATATTTTATATTTTATATTTTATAASSTTATSAATTDSASAPTLESVFGTDDVWEASPSGTGPNGTFTFNSEYFATAETAQKLADMLGGTVVSENEIITNGGPFSQTDSNLMIQMPDGAAVNAGLIASFYTHGFSQAHVDALVSGEFDSVRASSGITSTASTGTTTTTADSTTATGSTTTANTTTASSTTTTASTSDTTTPTLESVFGTDDVWVDSPEGTGPNGTFTFNSEYFATAETAQKLADMLGGTVVSEDEIITNGGPFSQTTANLMIQMPNGATVNAGLLASFYTHGFSQEHVDALIAGEFSSVAT